MAAVLKQPAALKSFPVKHTPGRVGPVLKRPVTYRFASGPMAKDGTSLGFGDGPYETLGEALALIAPSAPGETWGLYRISDEGKGIPELWYRWDGMSWIRADQKGT